MPIQDIEGRHRYSRNPGLLMSLAGDRSPVNAVPGNN